MLLIFLFYFGLIHNQSLFLSQNSDKYNFFNKKASLFIGMVSSIRTQKTNFKR